MTFFLYIENLGQVYIKQTLMIIQIHIKKTNTNENTSSTVLMINEHVKRLIALINRNVKTVIIATTSGGFRFVSKSFHLYINSLIYVSFT